MTASIEENYGKPLECHPSIEENGSSLQALLPAIQKNTETSERLNVLPKKPSLSVTSIKV